MFLYLGGGGGGAIVGLKSTLHTSFQHLNYRWDINCIDQLRDYEVVL